MENMKRSIGLRIKSLRMAKGITQEAFAEKCDISSRAVSNIERGKNFPSFDTLATIAGILECSLSDILDTPAGGNMRRAAQEAEALALIKSLPDDKMEMAVKLLAALL